MEKTRINPIFTENGLSKVSHPLSCRLNVALLKFPDVFKAWTVALNQKEGILGSIDEIKKDFRFFLTKVLPFVLRVRE